MKDWQRALLRQRARNAIRGLWHNANYRRLFGPDAIVPNDDNLMAINDFTDSLVRVINRNRKVYYGDDPSLAREMFVEFLDGDYTQRARGICRYGDVKVFGNSTIAPGGLVTMKDGKVWVTDGILEYSNAEEMTSLVLVLEAFNKIIAEITVLVFAMVNDGMDLSCVGIEAMVA